ncbi:MAG: wax ester/triacylglycerol synthase family O-acyltransferase [Gammaproteobacteria bacterium]|nr:wax ester/triacylglycerol synthase family O-acyltransferase [Gammaproteobacteria bacterium]
MEQLSGQDAMFLHAELDNLPQHIGGVSIYDQSSAPGGKVRFKQILALLENRLHLSPIFRRKLVTVPGGVDRPYWVDDPDFDLEYHVRHIALPKPGDWRQLCILVSRLHSQSLPRGKPLWEIYIIEGLDNVEGLPPKCFALLMKVHHAAMDGATGAQFMNIMHDLEPTTAVHKAPAEPWTGEKVSTRTLLGKAYRNAWRKPGDTWKLAKQIVPAMRRISAGRKNEAFDTLDDKPETRFQGKISRHRVVEARKFDFDVVRAIKNTQPGTTVNDVMLTIVAGGLRRYLESKGELPEQSLVTGCPIDVRTEEERSAGGNMVGFMNVALHTQIANPAQRLKAVHDSAVGAKIYAQALGPRIILDITNFLPGNVLAVAMRAATATGLTEASIVYNTIITNVPGPPHQMYFCGATLIDSLSFGPLLPNVGLFHIVYSSVLNKRGTITLSFTACREMLPDPAFYAECLQESFEELEQATLGK